MKTMIDAVVIDDHPLVARASMVMAEGLGYVRDAGVAHTGEEGLALVEQHRPALVILDDRLPDIPSAEVAVRIRECCPDVRLVWFAAGEVRDAVGLLMDSTINGIISKHCEDVTFQRMVGSVLKGLTVMPDDIFQAVMEEMRKPNPLDLLNDQERTIMNLLIQGSTHDQIARHIHVSRRSVDNYLRKIYEKLGVTGKLQAIERLLNSLPPGGAQDLMKQ